MRYGSLITAMITPFDSNLEVDYTQARKIARHLIDTGNEGIILAGTTGESPTLTQDEKDRLLTVVKEEVGDQADVIIGAGSNSTAETIKAVKRAEKLGADGIMLVVPYYSKPSQEGMYEHFKAAAESSDRSVILYNIPSRCGSGLLPETIGRLAEIPQITTIKEASGSLDQVMNIRLCTPKDFRIYSGDDAMTLPMLAVGGCGIISVAGHIAGNTIAAILKAWKQGDTDTAIRLHTTLYPLFKALFIAPNPAPVKYALSTLGFDCNRLRLPMTVVGGADERVIDLAMEGLRN